MKMIMAALTVFLAGAAQAGTPEKAKLLELRSSVKEGQVKLKRIAADQHKALALIRQREKSDGIAVKASASKGETLRAAKIEVHEKSRRDRRTLRESSRSERARLKAAIKSARAEMAAQRRKK